MIELLDDLPQGVLGFHVHGELETADYRDVLRPAIDNALVGGGTLRVVLVIDEWDGMSGGAMWQDLTLGIEHLSHWERVALVTDIDWMRHATKFFGWLTPGDVQVFPLSKRDDAIAWATTG